MKETKQQCNGQHLNIATNLFSGSILSLTSTRSLSVNRLHFSSRILMHTESGWHNFTKSMSNITLFRRTSSSFRKKNAELNQKWKSCLKRRGKEIATSKVQSIKLAYGKHHTINVCSSFLTSERRRASSIKGNFAIPLRKASRGVKETNWENSHVMYIIIIMPTNKD